MIVVIKTIIAYFRYADSQVRPRQPAYNTVCQLSNTLWNSCCSRRDMFNASNPLETIVPGLAPQLRVHLRDILYSYMLLSRCGTCIVPPWHKLTIDLSRDDDDPVRGHAKSDSLNTRKLYLMCWYYRDDPWRMGYESMHSLAFLPDLHGLNKLSSFVHREIVSVYGAEPYLARARIALDTSVISEIGGEHLSGFMGVQCQVLKNKAFDPYFYSSGFVEALRQMLERQNEHKHSNLYYDRWYSRVVQGSLDILRSVRGVKSLKPVRQALIWEQIHN